jgi:hypothetical protein
MAGTRYVERIFLAVSGEHPICGWQSRLATKKYAVAYFFVAMQRPPNSVSAVP